MTRTQKILSGLLVLQLILVAVVFWPRQAAAVTGGPLFAELDPAEVVRLRIEEGSGGLVELARQESGWVLVSGGGYPADSERIEPILAKIAAAQTARLVTNTAASHKLLQVDEGDYVRRVTMELGNGRNLTFYMGTGEGPNATHVRRAGEDATYLVNNLTIWEVTATPSNWLKTEYVALDRAAVTAVTLQNGNGRFVFGRLDADNWTMEGLAEGETFNQGNFNVILNRATSLRLLRPLGNQPQPEYGLDAPRATLTLTVEEGSATSSNTLTVGAVMPDGTPVIKWSGSDYYVTISAFTVEEMVNFDRTDFVNSPEETAEEEAP